MTNAQHAFDDYSAAATVKPFNDVKAAAIAGDWETVDSMLAKNRDAIMSHSVVAWASGAGLVDPDDNVRDLAASILEKAVPERDFGKFRPEVLKDILHALQNDSNPAVRFRLAFALWNRKDQSELVMQTMREATNDPDVGEIAKKYLGI